MQKSCDANKDKMHCNQVSLPKGIGSRQRGDIGICKHQGVDRRHIYKGIT